MLIRVSFRLTLARSHARSLSPRVFSFVDLCAVTIALLVYFSTLTQSRPPPATMVLASTTTANHPRWHRPCAGSAPVKLGHIWEQYEGRVPTIDTAQHFERIAEKANWLKAKVHTLKSLYVRDRFGDEEFVRELDQMMLDGMPAPTLTERSIFSVDVMATVQKAIENLARGAVFVEQARIDETIYSHEETSYRTHFEDVENQGIYWLMCEMQKFLAASGRWVNSDVTRDIMSIQIRDITTRSNRHVRDYIILRDLQKILYKVNVDFSMLKERVAPRRTSRR
ncbi:hypothetical protein NP493_58g05020 [Ridgeia piscesae]|uniref:Uncharacterized protein n=1 Tax=Ridgeia piscesae TaxID=27915 RepID=A0AAD9PAC8_RIDPI|nr:hypothetical protein NP493_58g05020 [Ridgeia piscesae]